MTTTARLVIKGTVFEASAACAKWLPEGAKTEHVYERFGSTVVLVDSRVPLSTMLGRWFSDTITAPFPAGALLFYSFSKCDEVA